MDSVIIYTNNKNIMDINCAKKTILSIANKFHINHIDFLSNFPSFSVNPFFAEGKKEILCEMQIEPFLDSESCVDFEKSKMEFTQLYGRQYAYFEKNNAVVELNDFIGRLKRESAIFVELGQLYKILHYHKQKFSFAKSQDVSIAKEIYEEINWIRKSVLKLLPNCPLHEINYKFHFETNNRVYRLKEINRQQLILFEENKNRTCVNLLKQISNMNYRLDFLLNVMDPSTMEKNEAESLKKKLIVLEKDLKKSQEEKFKKIKYLPEEKIEVEKKKLIKEENKKCEIIIAKNITTLHSESNIRNIQRYCEDPKYFNEEHFLKIGFFFPGMASFKKNNEEKYALNKLIESECRNFKIKFKTDYSPLITRDDSAVYKKKIDELYEQLKNLHKSESYPDAQVILKYCEKNKISVKDVVNF